MNMDIDEEARTAEAPVVATGQISSNDRNIVCGIHCTRTENGEVRFTIGNDNDVFTFNNVTLDARYLNVEELELKLSNVSESLEARVSEYKRWLEDEEAMFEAKYMLREIRADAELFNRVNNTIGRLRQGKKILNKWNIMMRNRYTRIIRTLYDYKRSKSELETNQNSMVYSSGLDTNPVTLAKKKEARSKSIVRQINRVVSSETKLEHELLNYQMHLDSFKRNVIQIDDDRELDMVQLGKDIESLSENASPLARVQEDLAARINADTVKHTLRTRDVSLKAFRDTLTYEAFPTISSRYVTTDHLIDLLTKLSNYSIYTNNSKDRLERVLTYADNLAQTSERSDEINRLSETIRKNDPKTVIESLQYNVEPDPYECVLRIENILKNLDHRDRVTYQPVLNAILDSCREKINEQLRTNVR